MLITLLKHAKHFTDANGRDASQVLHFYENGSLFMSNGIIGVLAANVHDETNHTRMPTNKLSKKELLSYERMYKLVREADCVAEDSNINCNIDIEEMLSFAQGVSAGSKLDEQFDEYAKIRMDLGANEGLVCKHSGFALNAKFTDNETEVSEDVEGAAVNGHELVKVLKLLSDLGYEDANLLVKDGRTALEIRSYDAKVRTIILPMK